jgi:dolichol-phosphate mannosyltransferase
MKGALRFGRFNLVGLFGAVLQLLLYFVLMKAGRASETTATLIAVEIVILHNFLWHERFTWRDREPVNLRQRTMRLCRFHAGNGVISLAGNTLLTYAFVEWLGIPALPSAIAAITLCAPANYIVADRWVYSAG